MWNFSRFLLRSSFARKPIENAFLRFCVRHRFEGVWVYTDPSDGSDDDVLVRTGDAFALISNIDADLAGRVQGLLPHLLVKAGIQTQFWSASRTCVIDRDFVLRSSDAYLACVLVHESVHARLRRFGIRTTKKTKGRIEALCIKSQIGFLEELPRDMYPGTDHLITYLSEVAANSAEGSINTLR